MLLNQDQDLLADLSIAICSSLTSLSLESISQKQPTQFKTPKAFTTENVVGGCPLSQHPFSWVGSIISESNLSNWTNWITDRHFPLIQFFPYPPSVTISYSSNKCIAKKTCKNPSTCEISKRNEYVSCQNYINFQPKCMYIVLSVQCERMKLKQYISKFVQPFQRNPRSVQRANSP